MSTGGNDVRLAALTRDLFERWRQTRESWMDAKAREFDDRFMKELETAVNLAIIRMQTLDAVLRRVRRDCE
jgi:hypothetical protein